MADIRTEDEREPTHQPDEGIARGSKSELVAAIAGLAAAVIGLAGFHPSSLAAVATIAVGFALLVQGSSIANRWTHAIHIPASERSDVLGIGTEVLGGLAAMVIGVLAVIGISPVVLLPAAALVLGSALMLGGPAQPALVELGSATAPPRWVVVRDRVRASGSVMVMAGVAALVLGILALAAGGPVVRLSLVAMLCVAASLIMVGSSLIARIARRFA
ncbi:MAG: hypothetical protein H6Q90_49 [Deltaproteobacteria bacterium]|nr:hypothetical protein [Deltaproteobacteria bacterium]